MKWFATFLLLTGFTVWTVGCNAQPGPGNDKEDGAPAKGQNGDPPPSQGGNPPPGQNTPQGQNTPKTPQSNQQDPFGQPDQGDQRIPVVPNPDNEAGSGENEEPGGEAEGKGGANGPAPALPELD